MNIPECYHKKCFQNSNIKSQVDEVDIVDKQAIMKVHPMRTLGVEALLDLPAPPQQASCLENISQIELVSPKPCPAPSNPKSAGRLFESSSEETDLADELLIGFEEGVLFLAFCAIAPPLCASRVLEALFFGSVGTSCYDKCIYHSKFNAYTHFALGSSLMQPLNWLMKDW